jgi:hypothetical protein
MSLDYVVRMTTDDLATCEAFTTWMLEHHLGDVLRAGALGGTVTREDGGPPYAVENRYEFASRAAFAEYERVHAARLRAEATRLFPHVTFARRFGERLR